MNKLILILIFTFAGAWLLTAAIRRYALKNSIIDLPNQRSSHDTPTPRGGGLAIAVVFSAFLTAMFLLKQIDLPLLLAFGGGGLLIAAIGLLDDLGLVNSFKLRLVGQFIAAGWGLYWLGGLPDLTLGFTSIKLGWLGLVLGILGVIWVTNLYNFMDGIDGLAGAEAVSSGVLAGIILLLAGFEELAWLSFGLASASLGFLFWNWPRAKIFMGDVGSGFLGFSFALLAVASENSGALPLLAWGLLLGVFLVDTTVTLVRRILGRERWWEAHRSHAYQLAVQRGHSHRQVTLTILAINLALTGLIGITRLVPAALAAVFGGTFLVLVLIQLKLSPREELRQHKT